MGGIGSDTTKPEDGYRSHVISMSLSHGKTKVSDLVELHYAK